MNKPATNSAERRLSVSDRNAYFIIRADESATNSTKKNIDTNKKIDDSLYLTAKPANRVRYFSEGCHPSTEQKSKEVGTSSTPASIVSKPEITAAKVQVGMDRYITILKRGRSPNSSKMAPMSKMSKSTENINTENRFALLASDAKKPKESPKSFKPPPIYLREANTNDIIRRLVTLIGENSFYVAKIKRGSLFEIKIQVNNENEFRKVITDLENAKKNFYTYQLKSSKGMQVVIKGIDSCVTPDEVKDALKDKGFAVKSVGNIKNRDKVPQPLFRIELEPGDSKLKKNETHPIYNLKYLLHRRVTVEEPHKRTGPVQCVNCQEFGHTKAYCKLPSVCVICGELHASVKCDKPKEDSKVKKCSNCGGNHTANYRSCPIYNFVRQSVARKHEVTKVQSKTVSTNNPSIPVTNNLTYADILKASQATLAGAKHESVPKSQPKTVVSESNYSRLEATIDSLVQTTNSFTSTMTNLLQDFTNSISSMMKEMMKMQQIMLEAIINKP